MDAFTFYSFFDYGETNYYYLFELANYSLILLLSLFTLHRKLINLNSFVVLQFFFLTPFIFNYVLFDPRLFGDQYFYVIEAAHLRQNLAPMNLDGFTGWGQTVTLTSAILGFLPIPAIVSVTSLAFSNKLLFLILFVWLARYIPESRLIFIFLLPSLLLYTSLSLRDPLIIFLSIFFLILTLQERKLLPIILLIPLIIIKPQNALYLSLFYILVNFFRGSKSFVGITVFSFISITVMILFEERFLEIMNLYRVAFAQEDSIGGYGSFTDAQIFQLEYQSFFGFLASSIYNSISFLLMPFPWEARNLFYLLQFFESVAIIALIIYIVKRGQLYLSPKFASLSLSLIAGILMYSAIAFNEGTFVRYRFVLLFPYIISFLYLIYFERDDLANNDL
tara:strand:+ start:7793 stop:8968 length:1176 start_codon:yes stop_codon:yes gene_type:complete